jgi:hypothetical protein
MPKSSFFDTVVVVAVDVDADDAVDIVDVVDWVCYK